jgi:DNA repair photolyase
MFSIISKFTDAGINCGVNIDPIIPLVTDSEEEVESILNNCNRSGVRYVFGAPLRLRADILERIQTILELLHVVDGIEVYKKGIYQFRGPLKLGYNIAANASYSSKVIQNLANQVLERGMIFDFPNFVGHRRLKSSKKKNSNEQQITLVTYM